MLAALSTCVVLAPVAGADLRPGTSHPFLVGKHGRLALPLPLPMSPPRLTGDKRGIAYVSVCVRYQVANWGAKRAAAPNTGRGAADSGGYARGRTAARHDRALVTVIVARRLLTTGPDPSNPLYRRTIVDVGGLNRQHVVRCYKFELPGSASRFLISHGAYARTTGRRRSARRLLWIDIQQDRDFKHVDGRYDWREGTAIGAADRGRPRQGDLAHASAGEQNPYGTLSITNNTASGVYCASGCPLVNSSTGLPGTVAGTMNSSTYSTPLAVAGDAVQCFDQGTNGSDPAGFANVNAAGVPQPYVAGTVSAAASGSQLPNTSGTTVTEGLAADNSLAWAGNQQTADTSGYISGAAKLGLQAIKAGVTGMVSPGAVITGILGIFEYFLENSCKESGNYFNVTATETHGAAASATINAQTEEWGYYGGSGSSPPGLQLNPSGLKLSGARLWLNTDQAEHTGLADNGCDCSNNTGNNAIELNWGNYNPCFASPAAQCSADPPGSPTVTNTASTGSAAVNCGTGNLKCPFPAAHFPLDPGVVPIYAGLNGGSDVLLWKCNPIESNNCQTLDTAGSNTIDEMVWANKSIYAGLSNGILWQCNPVTANACTNFDNLGNMTGSADQNAVTALAYGDGYVYVGVYTEPGETGQIYRCSATVANNCSFLDNAGDADQINYLLYENGVLYAGISNGVLWSCNPSSANACSNLDNAGGNNPIDSLTYGSGVLYAGLGSGILWDCSPTIENNCVTIDQAGNSISYLEYGYGQLYAAVPYEQRDNTPGVIWQCSVTSVNACKTLATTVDATALLLANNSVYYGGGPYIEKCSLSPSVDCQQLDAGSETDQYITGLVAPPPPSK